MKVIIIDKVTKEEQTLMDNLTEEQETKFCETWGWNYCNEQGKSYWLGVEK